MAKLKINGNVYHVKQANIHIGTVELTPNMINPVEPIKTFNLSDFDATFTWEGSLSEIMTPTIGVTVHLHPLPLMYLFPENEDDYPLMQLEDGKINVPQAAFYGKTLVRVAHPERDGYRWTWVWIGKA